MRYFIILTVLLLSSCQNETVNQEQDQLVTAAEKQIAKGLIQGAFDELWAGLDSTKISDYHTDDFIILEQGEIWDNQRIIKYMRQQLANTERPRRTNHMEYIAIDKYGKSMQIAYYNHAEFSANDSIVGKARWLESALAVETDEGWKLKMMHSTWAGE